MTSEDMERTMAFILEQQAQTNTTIGRLSERIDALSVKVDRNTDSITALLAVAEIQAAEIRDLTESVRRLGEGQQELDDRGRRTDERLDALINIVERHISEGHNRKA